MSNILFQKKKKETILYLTGNNNYVTSGVPSVCWKIPFDYKTVEAQLIMWLAWPQWNFKNCQQTWVMIRSKRKQMQARGYLRKQPKKTQLPKADLQVLLQ